ncbi:MAG: Hpt domain-containing protein [Gemmataceae bacterium]|nr:Hpt domain-containing protein [Gemmataceae bacterium]MCI0740392.1 Hpt domain-containing protein [Gemmataceae bacterium]
MHHEPLISDVADDKEMRNLLEEFTSGLSATCRRLEVSLAAGNVAEVQRLAHQLRGSSGGYGYSPISHAAALLEEAAHKPATTPDVIQSLGDKLLRLCKRAQLGMRSLLLQAG